jgi:signal peptidase I
MSPTLKDGQLVFTRRISNNSVPGIGNVVVIAHPVYGQIIKRIVAKQGDAFLVAGDGDMSTVSGDLGPIDRNLITSVCVWV